MGQKGEGKIINGESAGKEEDGDVVEPIQFIDVNSRNIFDLDITQLDIRKVNNHMKLSDISQLYYYLNKNSFCYTSEERPYISNMLQLKSFFSSNDVENYEILEQLKQHDERENSRMRKFNFGRVVARSKQEEKEMMGVSGGKRGSRKVGPAWNECSTVTKVGGAHDDSEADVQTDVGDEWEGDRDGVSGRYNDDGDPPGGERPRGGNNQTNRHHNPGETCNTSVSFTNSCHSSESISSTSSNSFCSSSSSSSASSSSSSSLSAFSPNRTDKSGKKGTYMSNLKILDVIKKYNENLEKVKKKKKKIKSRIGKLKKYDTVSIQGHNNKIVMSQIYKFVKKKSSVSIIGQLIYSSSDCKKFLYNDVDCYVNRWTVVPYLGYLNDISEQEVLHRIQVYNFYEFIYLFEEFPLCCQHNKRLSEAQLGARGSLAEGEGNDSGPCEYDGEIVFNAVERDNKNRSDQGRRNSGSSRSSGNSRSSGSDGCSFRLFYYDRFLCKNAQMVPQLANNCISINRSSGENVNSYSSSNMHSTPMRDTYNVFCDPNNNYVCTNKNFEYLYFFCFNCDTYYDINIILCHLLYSHTNGLKNSDPPWDLKKMYPFLQNYKKTYDVRIKRQKVKQTDIYFICPNCILNNVYYVMEHVSFFSYFCDLVNSHNHNFLIYNEYMKNMFNVELAFFSLYNVPMEKALVNVQKKKIPIVDKGKNLPARKGSKKKKKNLVCANGKRKSNKSGSLLDTPHGGKHEMSNTTGSCNDAGSYNTVGSSTTIVSESCAVGAQALVTPEPHAPPTRDCHSEVAERGTQEGHKSSCAAIGSEENWQLGGGAGKMEGSRVKGEMSPSQGQRDDAACLDGQQEPLHDNPQKEEAVKGEPCAPGQETFKEEETRSTKRRSDRKRKKKKEDEDELFDEGCVSNEREEEDNTFEDYLDGHTDEDIVEENQILIEEVYSGDSDFGNEELACGRKRRKKRAKKVKPAKKESSVKGKKNATREKGGTTATGGVHRAGSVPGAANCVGAERKKEEEYKIHVDDVNHAWNEDNAANRSISKYKKVIEKIKHTLDKENTTIDTKELSERIVKGVIQKFNDRMEVKMKLFSICSNLMRKDNSELRKKILNGIIHATDLAQMDSSDLAPMSLKNKRKEHERKYFYENIYLRENILDLKNNKNLEEEEEVFQHHPSVILQQKAQVSSLQDQQENNHQGRNIVVCEDGGVMNHEESGVSHEGSGVNDEGLINSCDGKNKSSSNQSDELDPLKYGDSSREEKNVIPCSNSLANLSDYKQKRKGSFVNEDVERNLCDGIPLMEKYSFELTYQNLKSMYEQMPKYASSPILTFLDNSYNRIVAIMDASKNE
ncbi:hypothetical protein AK88_00021 [Plasmodium fragile]|uniref:TFIIS central domain-containing protein n=1 Tax=Plasmodium fragile TaxID=5857 RepID=A0A0D9QT97_PLAFR|nr:uncharacterized protein AK88_00021 [Plasmodium fragile]KJP90173.1 hypothetical protein AK88_00021 [Plasmodium fragile]